MRSSLFVAIPLSVNIPFFGVILQREDLIRDHKLEEKYLNSQEADFFFLLAADDEIARDAVIRYADNPDIGVVSIKSGTVFLIPRRQNVPGGKREHFMKMLKRRGRHDGAVQFWPYYDQDEDIITLLMDTKRQNGPIVQSPKHIELTFNSNSFA